MDDVTEQQQLDFATYTANHVDRTNSGACICMLCGTVIKQECNLKRHFVVRHSESCQYFCPFCKRSYKNKHSFSNHMSGRHPEYKGLNLDRYAVRN